MTNQLPDSTTVVITYPGNKETKHITLGALKEWLKAEDPEWREKFFELLEKTGSAYGRVAKYSIEKLNTNGKEDPKNNSLNRGVKGID